MSYPYSTEFKEKIIRAYFLQKVRLAFKKFEDQKQEEEFSKKHYCENNKNGHQFQKLQPFLGCVKLVCKFCNTVNPDKLFAPSVYGYKGHSFEVKKKQ